MYVYVWICEYPTIDYRDYVYVSSSIIYDPTKLDRHLSPTSNDLVDALNGATIFLKFNLHPCYHQLSLAPESRYITTFATHEGLRRYTRLNFGTYSGSEKFQHVISEQICDISRTISISDDIIAFGRHDSHMIRLCMRCCIDFQILGSQSPIKKCEHHKAFGASLLGKRSLARSQECESNSQCTSSKVSQWSEKFPWYCHLLCQIYF